MRFYTCQDEVMHCLLFELAFRTHSPALLPTRHHVSVFVFGSTDITGTIPTFIGTFTNLGMFSVRTDLALISSWTASDLHLHLHLHSSSFSPSVHRPLKGYLDMMGTRLEGTVPTDIFQATKLTREWESRCVRWFFF